jgi:hypothetical protein
MYRKYRQIKEINGRLYVLLRCWKESLQNFHDTNKYIIRHLEYLQEEDRRN